MVGWLNLVYVIFAAYAFALSDRRANSLPDHSSHHKSRVRVRLAANGDRGGKGDAALLFFSFGAHTGASCMAVETGIWKSRNNKDKSAFGPIEMI